MRRKIGGSLGDWNEEERNGDEWQESQCPKPKNMIDVIALHARMPAIKPVTTPAT
ncbi:MAG TPA: hypothetical protein VFB14_13620 [Bryobacteraceae bacterium]|nr:hypothetical protein [Bryobacteraceae bacterium]